MSECLATKSAAGGNQAGASGRNDPGSGETLQIVFAKVEQAKREWEATVDSLPDLVLLVNDSGQVLRANRAVEDWLGCRVTEAPGRRVHKLVHPACTTAACELAVLLNEMLLHTFPDQAVEREITDRILNRHLLIKVRPVTDRQRGAAYGTVIVMQDVTELRRLERQQRALIEELDAFDHMVAHDLKNPIGIMQTCAQELSLSAASMDAGDLQPFLETLQQAGRKVANIIDELLLLAGMRKMGIEAAPLDMDLIVDDARGRLADMIAATHAVIELPEIWPDSLGYGAWIEEVWVNYMSNAIKYGGTPPHLALGADAPREGMVRFWLRDNGSGVPPDQQAQLFTPFTRLARARGTGHGLGLSIVRRIVERLGGEVGLESEGLTGAGSLFYFTLRAG